ncbi:hypothetical protein G9A89_017418 [Geosiphon pyriformis]|nr:hypothetical protein G9A89_017418 [Geosiphon pyriformis]
MYGHFKTPPREKLLIELKEEKKKPTWEAYQVLWADEEHNKLPPILSWDNNNKEKGKQKEELTWETDDLTWTDNDESEPTSSWEWEENKENKGKGKKKETTQTTTAYNTYIISQQSTYHRPKLICIDCGKKLSSMGACCGDDEEYSMATRFYCRPCIFECFGRPKQYCDECDLIYNPPPHMIYTILEEKEPISSCTSELRLPINHDSNSGNDGNNNGLNSIQNGNDNNNDSNSDTNSEVNYKQYIALPDLSKEQELKWYSDNGEGIMPERVHNTDAGFDLRYPEKDAIKLEPH